MRKIRLLRPEIEDAAAFPWDCERIVRILAERGFEATREEAAWLWAQRSDDIGCGWHSLDDKDDQIYRRILPYFENEECG